jgi:ADP-ribosylglycohydrolase
MIKLLDRYLGCILGGALGDALGYAVEFDSLPVIVSRYGESGIRTPKPDPASGKALISDDTQMTLFTIDGIINYVTDAVENSNSALMHELTKSYLKWLHTQTAEKYPAAKPGECFNKNGSNYDLLVVPELYNRRAPGRTCLFGLIKRSADNHDKVINDSKGCGAVMRVAPIGLYLHGNYHEAYRIAKESSYITHGHYTSGQASGALASIIALILNGNTVAEAVSLTLPILNDESPNGSETVDILHKALSLADDNETNIRDAIRQIGEGWVAEEALAISVYCALKADSFTEGVIYAVNHDGDSDSTGAICGNILGALYGYAGLPEEWMEGVELREVIEGMVREFYRVKVGKGK